MNDGNGRKSPKYVQYEKQGKIPRFISLSLMCIRSSGPYNPAMLCLQEAIPFYPSRGNN